MRRGRAREDRVSPCFSLSSAFSGKCHQHPGFPSTLVGQVSSRVPNVPQAWVFDQLLGVGCGETRSCGPSFAPKSHCIC